MSNFRMQRIEKLLHELTYEVERGFQEGEIDETMSYSHIYPISRSIRDGAVLIRFETRPMTRDRVLAFGCRVEPKLRLVTP